MKMIFVKHTLQRSASRGKPRYVRPCLVLPPAALRRLSPPARRFRISRHAGTTPLQGRCECGPLLGLVPGVPSERLPLRRLGYSRYRTRRASFPHPDPHPCATLPVRSERVRRCGVCGGGDPRVRGGGLPLWPATCWQELIWFMFDLCLILPTRTRR